MTIDEATATLGDIRLSNTLQWWPDAQEATRLGEEALKEIKKARGGYLITNASLLPGETEG